LTTEAAAALDTELHRRNLTESDRVEHQRFVKRQGRLESRSRRRKIFGGGEFSWHELLGAFGAMALISFAYLALPSRYHLKPDWQEAAVYVMIAAVAIAAGWRNLWRDIAFWMTLTLSSSIQLAVAHAWIQRRGDLSRSLARGATLLGLVLFVALYGIIWLLRRKSHRAATSNI
jgi:hypothetical protein